MRDFIVTTGDPDGIGLEVSLKALSKHKLKTTDRVLLFSKESANFISRALKTSKNSVAEISDIDELKSPSKAKNIKYFLMGKKSQAPEWVEAAAKYCLKNPNAALVTGPLSKTLIHECGLTDMGHTGILKRVSKAENVNMAFVGKHFCVFLTTDHIPLNQVSQKFPAKLESTILAALQFRSCLPGQNSKKPVAILGLNPHAGESGLLGIEESSFIAPLIQKLQKQKFSIVGPLVPDAAFLKKNWALYSMYVGLYHDQALIPFKMAHGAAGAHVSWGLPFVRTSVDHGTAKDIFGKNKADPGSMLSAIQLANRLLDKYSAR